MTNYWLSKIDEPTPEDKVYLRQVLFQVRDQVFDYITSLEIGDKDFYEKVRSYLVELMFGLYRDQKINHFAVSANWEDNTCNLVLAIRPKEGTEYFTVEFVLSEIN